MSTNEKHVEQMSTKTNYSFKAIDNAIYTLTCEMDVQATAVAETQGGRLERLLKVYAGVKPLLIVLATLPVIPYSWRAALALFNSTIAAVAAGVGDDPDFKAGKDL
jgi:hypothetical protein